MNWEYLDGEYRAVTSFGTYIVRPVGVGVWNVELKSHFGLFPIGVQASSRLGMAVAHGEYSRELK